MYLVSFGYFLKCLFSPLQGIIYFISFREILCLKKPTCKKECFIAELLHSLILYLVDY